jgi:hypothetical protein
MTTATAHATKIPSGLLGGRLEGISPPDLVWSHWNHESTGVLEISRGPVTKTLYFKGGRIVFAASGDPNDRLGEMLLRQGKITLDQLEEALRRRGSGKRLGTLLVEVGSLTPDGLVAAVLEQVRTIVLDVLAWTEGSYRFKPGDLPTKEAVTLDMHTGALLLEAVRRIPSFVRIRQSVGGPRTVYGLTAAGAGPLEGLELSESERLVLGRLEGGPLTVDALCRQLLCSNYEIHQALWSFKVLGVVAELTGQAAPADSETEGPLGPDGFAGLLVRYARDNADGLLLVARGSVERTFHLRGGRCRFATSSDPDDGLVSYLLRRGVISLREREETARRLLSNKRVGTILREMGVIDQKDLEQAVREQLVEIVCDTISWIDGEYAFSPGALPSSEDITLDLDSAELVREGVRRIRAWTRIILGCGGIDTPLVLTPSYLDVLDRLGAGVEEWQVVNALKIPQTPRRICRLSRLPDFRVCQILWTLRLLGAVEETSADDVDETLEPALLAALEGRAGGPHAVPSDDEPGDEPDDTRVPVVDEDDAEEPVDVPVAVTAAPIVREPERAEAEPQAGWGEVESPDRQEQDETAPALGADEVEAVQDDPPLVAPEPEEELSPEGEEAIRRFNTVHRVVYRTLRAEIGAGAGNFVRSSLGGCPSRTQRLLDGVALTADGAWDPDGLRRAARESEVGDPRNDYFDLVTCELDRLEEMLGQEKIRGLRRRIEEAQESEVV